MRRRRSRPCKRFVTHWPCSSGGAAPSRVRAPNCTNHIEDAMRLSEIAQVIRSKNAGPRRLTLDVMFASDADYQRVVQSSAFSREAIGALYRIAPEHVAVIPYP